MSELLPGLYLGDNGRCFCASLRCAGATAYYTGRDLSGQRVHRLSLEERARLQREGVELACEDCRARSAAVLFAPRR